MNARHFSMVFGLFFLILSYVWCHGNLLRSFFTIFQFQSFTHLNIECVCQTLFVYWIYFVYFSTRIPSKSMVLMLIIDSIFVDESRTNYNSISFHFNAITQITLKHSVKSQIGILSRSSNEKCELWVHSILTILRHGIE